MKRRSFESLAQQSSHPDYWERTVADTRILGTTKRRVGVAFETTEKGKLNPLRRDRFPYYEMVRRRYLATGILPSSKHTILSPPKYLSHDVWVRCDSKMVRILNHRMESIAVHCTQPAGRFSTLGEHIHPSKSHMTERGLEYILKKVRFIGPHATSKAESTIESRGIDFTRVLQGLLSLKEKYKSEEIDRAYDTAWRSKACNSRVIKRLPDRLIIDDPVVPGKQVSKRSGDYLFEIIMRRHELRSTMLTSNRPREDRGQVIGDVPSAAAILDRPLHRVELVQITGKSFRSETAKKAQTIPSAYGVQSR